MGLNIHGCHHRPTSDRHVQKNLFCDYLGFSYELRKYKHCEFRVRVIVF